MEAPTNAVTAAIQETMQSLPVPDFLRDHTRQDAWQRQEQAETAAPA